MPSRPDAKVRRYLYAIGVLGALIVIASTAFYKTHSALWFIGYVVGFICMLMAAMAGYAAYEERASKQRDDSK
ncbi:hypothetical protein [Alicyclobacillus vulcanalis]|uniref:Uncharacterized protein n=1 Tax=Alicyclobacillus vulcanalis TaxID=252246 RepID=A0A1N7JZL4_9BACL|nr:hypothetical protein [Alicyclobacillus vulcanalis]SIS54783.1 hypothetical protein SAMN05421799_101265 [Alicyclobacillus vulcanalis]